jgi:hypothetical protein
MMRQALAAAAFAALLTLGSIALGWIALGNAPDGDAETGAITAGRQQTPENTVRGVSDPHGSIQSIPGIEGIDTVTLENLEAVLRMQDRATEPQSQGSVRTAAALMTIQVAADDQEVVIDARDEHLEIPLEGS